MFVQIHTLRSFPPHIPNRGADGLAKRGIYGEVERQRISYQCHQHSVKTSPLVDAMKAQFGGTLRSRLIGERLIKPQLEAAGLDEADAATWASEIMALWKKKKKPGNEDEAKGKGKSKSKKKPSAKADSADEFADAAESEDDADSADSADTDQPLVLGEKEADALAVIVCALHRKGVTPKQLRSLFEASNKMTALANILGCKKDALPAEHPEAVAAVEAFAAIKVNAGFDGSLFGRMATGVAVSNVRRAVRFSDWITTHPITSISDFFSTNDSLKDADSDESGASHINNRELGVGVFYQHVVIDVDQLKANLGIDDVSDVVDWIISALVEVDPVNGRANSRLVEMAVQIGPKQPRSLMDAYLTPVPGPEAAKALRAFAEAQDRIDGIGAPDLWLTDIGIAALRSQVMRKVVES